MVNYILQKLEPTLFEKHTDDDRDSPWHEEKNVDILCMAIKVRSQTALPFEQYGIPEDVESCATALSQHYNKKGKALHGMKRDAVLAGYYKVDAPKQGYLQLGQQRGEA